MRLNYANKKECKMALPTRTTTNGKLAIANDITSVPII